jgi:hypothetical protein
MSTMYQHNRDVAHDLMLATRWSETPAGKAVSVAKALPGVTGRLMAYWLFANVAAEMLVGRGPEEDAEWQWYIARKLLMAPISTIPWAAGPIERGLLKKRASLRLAPAFSAIDRAGGAVSRLLDDDADTDAKEVWDVVRSAGVLLGIPTRPIRALEYLTSEEGVVEDIEQADVAGIASGVWFGKRPEQPWNPLTPFMKE